MKEQRIDSMEAYILTKRSVTIDELCERFSVSVNTVRRDLGILCAKGTVRKTYGGASANVKEELIGLMPFNERLSKNSGVKAMLAQSAAEFVRDNDVIYIDTGSTTVGITDLLKDRKNVTVITNSVTAIIKLLPMNNLNVIAIPGILDRTVAAFVGPQAVESIQSYNITKAFMTCTAFSLKGGVMNSTPEEYMIKQTVISHSLELFLLADKDKFGKHSLMTYAKLENFDYLITDMPRNEQLSKFASANKLKLISV